jgi:hypothetical protein
MTNEKGPAPGVAERRAHPRYGFNADAELVEDASGTRIEARITDVSRRGCYVETARSFSLGTTTKCKLLKAANLLSLRAESSTRQRREWV